MKRRSRTTLVGLAVALATLGVGIGVAFCDASASRPTVALSVGSATDSQALPSGFLGISFEFKTLEQYVGANPGALDPAFLALVRQLSPGGSPVIRIGGDSTDWTWWPVPGMAAPGGVRFTLDQTWLRVAGSLARALKARMILGVQFEADSPVVAAAMARAFAGGIGAHAIAALELGNEPELYPSFSWYKNAAGVHVTGRPRSYTFQSYLGDFAHIAGALPAGLPVAGPSSGGPEYLRGMASFVAGEPRVRLVTVHAYPLKHCRPTQVPTIAQLLSPAVSAQLAAHMSGFVALARAHRLPLRLDEINSVSCGGWPAVTYSFASALWALGELFQLQHAGVNGVNFDTVPGTWQHLITAVQGARGKWTVGVLPEYYGLLAFAQAAPLGSRQLPVSGGGASGLETYATIAPSKQIHVVVINPTAAARSVGLKVAGAAGSGVLARLSAPSLASSSGVTLGGQTIAPSSGMLSGNQALTTVAQSGGAYTFDVSPGSAAILTIGGGPYP